MKTFNQSKVLIESSRKGSNPGGFCTYTDERRTFPGYFKYCTGARLPHSSYLKPEHQPIYEAVTFELARRLGLKTPNFFVLLNNKGNLIFDESNKSLLNGHSGRFCYFFSEKIDEPHNVQDLDKIGNKLVGDEKVYLDSLGISDVIGKRQNYMVLPKNGEFEVSYIDLGCSFVYAPPHPRSRAGGERAGTCSGSERPPCERPGRAAAAPRAPRRDDAWPGAASPDLVSMASPPVKSRGVDHRWECRPNLRRPA